jgi:Zn-finger nucleic acid-binding protein
MEPKCPECPRTLQPAEDRGQASAHCPGCGGVWVSEATLQACIREFLRQSGFENALVPLHERPLGPSGGPCPACGVPLAGIDLRGVKASRCNDCRHLFLAEDSVSLISHRVLLSIRAPKGRELSSNPILADMLRNPNRFGV